MAIKLEPKRENAYWNRGELEYDIHDYTNSIADFTKVIELNPSLADAYTNQARAEKALDALKK